MRIVEQCSLPRRDLQLPVFGLGGAQLGGLYRAMSDEDAQALIDTAWREGVRLFDTAPFYGYTRSERRLGRLLSSFARSQYRVSTKVGRLMVREPEMSANDDGWIDPLPFKPVFDYSAAGVMRSVEESMERTGLDAFDVLYVHDIGAVTHGERHEHYWQQLTQGGGFRALESLRREGVARAIGLGVNEWQVAHAALQELDVDCTMLAGRYTLLEQTSLAPFLDECLARGAGVVVAGPFNSGVLAGASTFNYQKAPAAVVERVRTLAATAAEYGVPLPAAALQFPLAHAAVVSCVVGAHDAAELRQNIAWFEHPIPQDFWLALRERALVDERAPLPVV